MKNKIILLLATLSIALIPFTHHFAAHLSGIKLAALLFSCILMFLASMFFSKCQWFVKLTGFSLIFLFVIFILTYFIAFLFTEEGINYAVISHLSLDSIEAGLYGWMPYHNWLVRITLSSISLVLCSLFINSRVVSNTKVLSLGYLCITLAILIHPGTFDLYKMYTATNQDSIDKHLQAQITAGAIDESIVQELNQNLPVKPDVLLIFLEGMEQAYLDNNLYPDLAPNLNKIMQEGQSYLDFTPSWGATHTIAGIVTAMCGTPYSHLNGASMQHGDGDFYMPKAQCLGDVTKKLGYQNLFYQGAKLSFSRKGSFFRAHGYDEVKGKIELEEDASKSDIASWGLQDSYVFDKVFDRLEELRTTQDRSPFLMTMLTLDGHDPWSNNYISSWCVKNQLGKYPNPAKDHPIQDSVYCTDNLLPHFLDKIKESWGDSLDIYLVSDHLAPAHSIGERHKEVIKENRKLIFTKVNGKNDSGENRRVSHLDVGATILDDITQGKIQTLGLGVSAKSDEQTLIEIFGQTELDNLLEKSIKGIAKLNWSQPNLKEKPIQFAFETKQIKIGDKEFPFPLAIPINQNGEMLNFHSGYIDSYLQLLKESSRIIYFDTCKNTSKYQKRSISTKDSTCVIAGNLGSRKIYEKEVSSDLRFTYEDLAQYLNEPTDNQLLNDNLYNIHGLSLDGTINAFSAGTTDVAPIAKMQFLAGQKIKYSAMNYFYPTVFKKPEYQNQKAPGHNGLVLYGVNNGSITRLHTWIDDCSSDIDSKEIGKILKKNLKIDNFILVTAQQGKCSAKLNRFFKNSPFEKDIESLEFNEPFVAYYNNKTGTYKSKKGEKNGYTVFTLVDEKVYGRSFE